jgi:hypothetical protein
LTGAGFTQGSRLKIRTAGSKVSRKVAVRTAVDREVGLTRQLDGQWTTISKMDEIIVAAPSTEDRAHAEILSFDILAFTGAFDEALAFQKKRTPQLSHKTMISLPLDDQRKWGTKRLVPGLKRLATWSEQIPFSSVHKPAAPTETVAHFIERVRNEYAGLTGVEASRVRTEFRIVDRDPEK